MQSKTKRTTRKTVAAATTTSGGNSRAPEPMTRVAARRGDDLLGVHLAAVASCAEELFTRGRGTFDDVFAAIAPVLDLDAYAAFVAVEGGQALAFEAAHRLSDTALSCATIAAIVAELGSVRRRTLFLESLAESSDARSAVFRDLGFASAAVGALIVDERVLGAVVLAARTKQRFSAPERAVLETAVSYATAIVERRALARQRDSAEQHKREFLTVLAHELRNPLAPVRNALEIIRAADRARSPVEHSAYAMIERQLQHIGRLADDLLDANLVVLGHVELERQRVLLDSIIDRAASQSRPWIEAARHTLVVDLPRRAVALDADPKRLARAFSNLINSASRRMDRGGHIVISAEPTATTVTVHVRARGRIVSGETLSEIFVEDMPRSDGQSRGGFTAGMTLVKHLVEMHGGAVSAHTNPDGVADFEVQLPILRATAAEPRKALDAAADDEPLHRTTPQRILIADDNADSAESMGMLLRLMGNDVRIASDGLEAVEQAERFHPDIVLMDIGMPRLDGYEAARQIRSRSWSRDTLLVAVTGWGPSDDSEEATAAGFDRHFTKPLDPAELRRLVSGDIRPH
jgi:signal transduction histidine kinase